MYIDLKHEKDLVDTETMLFTLAGQDSLTERRVILVIMESVVQLWLELKMQIMPHGNWEFTDSDREKLHTKPDAIQSLLYHIESRALPLH
jgi:hypothetical protein